MAFRRFPGLCWLPILALVGILAGCSLGRSSAPADGSQAAAPTKTQGVQEEKAVANDDAQAAPLTEPATGPAAPAIDPARASPLTVAMTEAGSRYAQGVQALQSGNADQAQWEFDAALEALGDNGLSPPASPGLVGLDRSPLPPLHSWLSPPVRPPLDVKTETPPEDPDEPNQEATALLGPEDVQAIETEDPDATPLPEPDVRKYEFPIVYNDLVRTFIHHFQNKKWGVITRSFERASRYMPMMRQVFLEKGLPEELLNLAFIESAVNPWATSRVKAAGIWQFMPATGRLYGMQVSWWVDERRDPEKATRGAAAYLKNLYEMFGAWDLALAAYNAGEGKVQRAIAKQGTRDYWKLRLPRETKLFVPAFLAMTIISKEPERYGFAPPPDSPFQTMTVTLDHPADFRTLARVAGTPVEHLRELNPALIRWSTPPGVSPFSLRVPADANPEFLEDLARVPAHERVAWVTHRVRKGETAPSVAKRYGANLRALLEMNGLKKQQPLKPGSSVLVPASAAFLPNVTADAAVDRGKTKTVRVKAARYTVQKSETVSKEERSRAVRKNLAGALAGPLSASQADRKYVVKPGDTLTEIARLHGVSLADLRRWNGLAPDASLRPGQTIRVRSSS